MRWCDRCSIFFKVAINISVEEDGLGNIGVAPRCDVLGVKNGDGVMSTSETINELQKVECLYEFQEYHFKIPSISDLDADVPRANG